MTEIDILALIAARSLDIADRAKAAGLLVAAAMLRETAREAEEAVLAAAPPVPAWAGLGAKASCPAVAPNAACGKKKVAKSLS